MKAEQFSRLVEEKVTLDESEYIDAIVAVCEEHEIDVIVAPKLLSGDINRRVEEEAKSRNLLKSTEST